MRLLNPYRTGVVVTLGVLTALVLGMAVTQLSSVLTYIGAALFIALGLQPLVRFLQRRGLPKGVAVLLVFVIVLGLLGLVAWVIVPVVVGQATTLIDGIADYFSTNDWDDILEAVQNLLPGIQVQQIADQVVSFIQSNISTIGGGVLQLGLGLVNGLFGVLTVTVLTIYFTASVDSIKRALYRLVPATKRPTFIDLAEEISDSVGKFVVGQLLLALLNGTFSFIVLSLLGASLPAVLAFIAGVLSLVPLIGTVSAAVIIVLAQVVLLPDSPSTWIAVAVWYLIYAQIEAYLFTPRIMNRTIKIPGVVVVIAALTGGTLLGMLGALVAIPVAAAIVLIVQRVVMPRQAEL